jgi:predicted DNA-binding ribbon-helix-helix protein
MIRKRSVTLQAHATSVSLEDQYWDELKRMAGELGVSLATLIERVDAARGAHNLSSALRLAVLADLKAKLAPSRTHGVGEHMQELSGS